MQRVSHWFDISVVMCKYYFLTKLEILDSDVISYISCINNIDTTHDEKLNIAVKLSTILSPIIISNVVIIIS